MASGRGLGVLAAAAAASAVGASASLGRGRGGKAAAGAATAGRENRRPAGRSVRAAPSVVPTAKLRRIKLTPEEQATVGKQVSERHQLMKGVTALYDKPEMRSATFSRAFPLVQYEYAHQLASSLPENLVNVPGVTFGLERAVLDVCGIPKEERKRRYTLAELHDAVLSTQFSSSEHWGLKRLNISEASARCGVPETRIKEELARLRRALDVKQVHLQGAGFDIAQAHAAQQALPSRRNPGRQPYLTAHTSALFVAALANLGDSGINIDPNHRFQAKGKALLNDLAAELQDGPEKQRLLNAKAGKNWRKRCRDEADVEFGISTDVKKQKRLSRARIHGENRFVLSPFVVKCVADMRSKCDGDLPRGEDIYNAHEWGRDQEEGRMTLGTKGGHRLRTTDGEHVSVHVSGASINCAEGGLCRDSPLVIIHEGPEGSFRYAHGKGFESCDFPVLVGTTKSGHMSERAFYEFMRLWVRNLRRKHKRWVFIFLDNHYSHLWARTRKFLRDHKVQVYFMPSHSSRVMQPADNAEMAARKRMLEAEVAEVQDAQAGIPMTLPEFNGCLAKVESVMRTAPAVRATIEKGWVDTGLWSPRGPLGVDPDHYLRGRRGGQQAEATLRLQSAEDAVEAAEEAAAKEDAAREAFSELREEQETERDALRARQAAERQQLRASVAALFPDSGGAPPGGWAAGYVLEEPAAATAAAVAAAAGGPRTRSAAVAGSEAARAGLLGPATDAALRGGPAAERKAAQAAKLLLLAEKVNFVSTIKPAAENQAALRQLSGKKRLGSAERAAAAASASAAAAAGGEEEDAGAGGGGGGGEAEPAQKKHRLTNPAGFVETDETVDEAMEDLLKRESAETQKDDDARTRRREKAQKMLKMSDDGRDLLAHLVPAVLADSGVKAAVGALTVPQLKAVIGRITAWDDMDALKGKRPALLETATELVDAWRLRGAEDPDGEGAEARDDEEMAREQQQQEEEGEEEEEEEEGGDGSGENGEEEEEEDPEPGAAAGGDDDDDDEGAGEEDD